METQSFSSWWFIFVLAVAVGVAAEQFLRRTGMTKKGAAFVKFGIVLLGLVITVVMARLRQGG